jgi:hypothetical protein
MFLQLLNLANFVSRIEHKRLVVIVLIDLISNVAQDVGLNAGIGIGHVNT